MVKQSTSPAGSDDLLSDIVIAEALFDTFVRDLSDLDSKKNDLPKGLLDKKILELQTHANVLSAKITCLEQVYQNHFALSKILLGTLAAHKETGASDGDNLADIKKNLANLTRQLEELRAHRNGHSSGNGATNGRPASNGTPVTLSVPKKTATAKKAKKPEVLDLTPDEAVFELTAIAQPDSRFQQRTGTREERRESRRADKQMLRSIVIKFVPKGERNQFKELITKLDSWKVEDADRLDGLYKKLFTYLGVSDAFARPAKKATVSGNNGSTRADTITPDARQDIETALHAQNPVQAPSANGAVFVDRSTNDATLDDAIGSYVRGQVPAADVRTALHIPSQGNDTVLHVPAPVVTPQPPTVLHTPSAAPQTQLGPQRPAAAQTQLRTQQPGAATPNAGQRTARRTDLQQTAPEVIPDINASNDGVVNSVVEIDDPEKQQALAQLDEIFRNEDYAFQLDVGDEDSDRHHHTILRGIINNFVAPEEQNRFAQLISDNPGWTDGNENEEAQELYRQLREYVEHSDALLTVPTDESVGEAVSTLAENNAAGDLAGGVGPEEHFSDLDLEPELNPLDEQRHALNELHRIFQRPSGAMLENEQDPDRIILEKILRDFVAPADRARFLPLIRGEVQILHMGAEGDRASALYRDLVDYVQRSEAVDGATVTDDARTATPANAPHNQAHAAPHAQHGHGPKKGKLARLYAYLRQGSKGLESHHAPAPARPVSIFSYEGKLKSDKAVTSAIKPFGKDPNQVLAGVDAHTANSLRQYLKIEEEKKPEPKIEVPVKAESKDVPKDDKKEEEKKK